MRSLRSKDRKTVSNKNKEKVDIDKNDDAATRMTVTPMKDELISSQQCDPHDPQLDVGWDCNSPDVIRQLRKASRLRKKTNIDDLVSTLIVNEGEGNDQLTPPLLGLWMNKDEQSTPNQAPVVVRDHAKRRLRPRINQPSRKQNFLAKQLIEQIEKKAVEKEVAGDDKSGTPTNRNRSGNDKEEAVENADESVELFEKLDKLSSPANTSTPNIRKRSERLTPIVELQSDSLVCKEKDVCANSDISWTDDEFFDDDSLIIKATQIPGSIEKESTKRKSDSPVLGNNSKKVKQYTFSLSLNTPNSQETSSSKNNISEKSNTSQIKQNFKNCEVVPGITKNTGKVTTVQNVTKAGPPQNSIRAKVANLGTAASKPAHFKTQVVNSQLPNPVPSKSVHSNSICNLTTRFNPDERTQNSVGKVWKKHNSFNDSFTNSKTNLNLNESCVNKKVWEPSKTSAFRRSNSFSSCNAIQQCANKGAVGTQHAGSNWKPNNVPNVSCSINSPVVNSSTSNSTRSFCSSTYPCSVGMKTCLSVSTSSVPACSSVITCIGKSPQSTCSKGNSSLNTSVVSSHSLNKATSSACSNHGSNPNNKNLSVTSKYTSAKKSSLAKVDETKSSDSKNDNTKGEIQTNKKDSVLDTSLTDDILLQLAEPDEILDSQIPFTQHPSQTSEQKELSNSQTSASKKTKKQELIGSDTLLDDSLSAVLGESDVFNNVISATQLQLLTEDDDSFDCAILSTPQFKSSANEKVVGAKTDKNVCNVLKSDFLKDHISPTQQSIKQTNCKIRPFSTTTNKSSCVTNQQKQATQKPRKFTFKSSQKSVSTTASQSCSTDSHNTDRGRQPASAKGCESATMKSQKDVPSVDSSRKSTKETIGKGNLADDDSDLFPSDDDMLTDMFTEDSMFAELDRTESQPFTVSSTQCSAAEIERKKQEALKRLHSKSSLNSTSLSQSSTQKTGLKTSKQDLVKR